MSSAKRSTTTSTRSELARAIVQDNVRTGLDSETLGQAVCDHLLYLQGRHPDTATLNDCYLAVSYAVRDRLFQRGVRAIDEVLSSKDARVVGYLSAEFLVGPQLGANLVNLGIVDAMQTALAKRGWDLEAVLNHEDEPGLGNGGLGRLAACYIESLATLEVPAVGYGIRYEFGIFRQQIVDGWQVEASDKWLRWGNPWEIARPEASVEVQFGGWTEAHVDPDGRVRVRWNPAEVVRGVPHEMQIPGYRVAQSAALRLWRAEAVESFDFQSFDVGDYYHAVDEKIRSETISKVLYPNDRSPQGKRLRLRQQYFFVSCALQDMMRMQLRLHGRPEDFHLRWAVQLNDTHPAIAVAELMRLLLDVHGLEWDAAWNTTVQATGFTNHTLLPEALERWPVALFAELLPRHLEIIYEINRRLLDDVRRKFPGNEPRAIRMSLIEEGGERSVRMANLACAGSHSINGVARLHSELLARDLLPDWAAMYPERFHNITNGVTPRRFLVLANPGLTALMNERLGEDWPRRLDGLRGLETLAENAEFQEQWRSIKAANKRRLAEVLERQIGITIDAGSLFDIQVKRIHEYKRQHLNVLHILTLYLRLRDNPELDIVPRTFLFGGKAAPGYAAAKLIIKLIHETARVVNRDPEVRGRLRVVFIPDFNVKMAQIVYPAADLSEQISTAGMEASGTGNMKFAMNGALTIGTLDGANIEIREEVGPENFYLFGLTADEVLKAKASGYNPKSYYESDGELRAVLDFIGSGALSDGNTSLFRPMLDGLLASDTYMLLADYSHYIACQEQVSTVWKDCREWTRRSVLNSARIGKFSSDRSVGEYCERVWGISTVTGKKPALKKSAARARRAAGKRRD